MKYNIKYGGSGRFGVRAEGKTFTCKVPAVDNKEAEEDSKTHKHLRVELTAQELELREFEPPLALLHKYIIQHSMYLRTSYMLNSERLNSRKGSR